jgi:hypothetical protein
MRNTKQAMDAMACFFAVRLIKSWSFSAFSLMRYEVR